MTSKNSNQLQEISLREIFSEIWNGKWLIILLTILGLTISNFLYTPAKEVYETEILYKKNYSISFLLNIKSIFYEERFFNQWKESSKGQIISYQDLSKKFTDEDVIYLKDKNDLEVFFKQSAEDGKLIIRSNDEKRIGEYFSYLNFLNDIIKEDILEKLNLKKKLISQSQLNAKLDANHILMNNLDIDYREIVFFEATLENDRILQIDPPQKPKLKNPHRFLVIAFGGLIAFVIGIILVFLKGSLARDKL